ncbi:hypothetical protein ACN47E_004998 [Coniothyrium glycines]
MTETTETAPAPAPKKRSFFKRAAWQDSAKKDGDDIFSHSNEFQDIVAEQTRRREEERQKEKEKEKERERDEQSRQQKQAGKPERKRRRVSTENDEAALPKSEASSAARISRRGSKARSRTPLSPALASHPPGSLAARYDSLTKSTSSHGSTADQKEAVVIDLGSDSEDDGNIVKKATSFGRNSSFDYESTVTGPKRDMPVRPSTHSIAGESDEDLVETLNPTLAALKAKARERAAQRAQSISADGQVEKAPIAQLLISPEIPDAKPLLVKVRIDSLIGKARNAWCDIQKYSPEMKRNVFFTWKGTRIYDSTSIKRLGIIVDPNGNLSVEGDTNLYDDVNVPKVVVEAWTEQLFQQRKREDAAEAAARKKAAEASPEVEDREPTPPPPPQATKVRLILKAKGKDDFKLSVNPDTTFGHIASAYKTKLKIDKHQPITLMFDGDRLMPLDTVADSEIEDMDALEILFK